MIGNLDFIYQQVGAVLIHDIWLRIDADLVGDMAADKAAAVRATGADLLVSQDCGCLMNIGGTLDRQGSGPPVRHIAELLWERTGGQP